MRRNARRPLLASKYSGFPTLGLATLGAAECLRTGGKGFLEGHPLSPKLFE